MYKFLPVLMAICLGLTACNPTSPTAVQPAPTENSTVLSGPAITPTQPPIPATIDQAATSPDTPSNQSGSTQPVAPASGLVVYQIIPGESQLTYEVAEVFINENNRLNVAIGVTSQIAGEITIDLNNPQNSHLGTITADISQFKSDSSRRDNAIRTRFLESARYPTVTFVPAQIEGLPASYQEGQEIALKISGDLTIRQTTRPVAFTVTVKLEGNTLSGQATTTILMSDFGFGPISIAGILKTEDQVKVTLRFVARP